MYYVYILTTKTNSTLYIGVTGNLSRRINEHKAAQIEGFTKKYAVNKLVYVEEYGDVGEAVAREKQLKRWTRAKKNALIETRNPFWNEWYV